MANVQSANDFGNKTKSRRDEIFGFISEVVSEETERFLNDEKTAALAADKNFQQKKEELAQLRAKILRPVVNKSWASLISTAMWKRAGFMDKDTLLSAIIDEKGNMWQDGNSVAVDTLSKAASFYAAWEKRLVRKVRKIVDVNSRIYADYIGAMGVGLFTKEECISKVAAKYEVIPNEVARIIFLKETTPETAPETAPETTPETEK